ncbi:hypothetical protein [Thermoanaerobacterium thermosaccharolyticum]|jgi:hypothetical protein|uniref:Uncharacterized protein n=3 Tax=Thermoanaerobacterium thermosaccharolyticum TaxID=1517 RepID=D9TM96_THETC|nr:hypothetical protein [Thermoanaerobacterium thermosaccharolyticum]ADL68940.1 conserved hypothetical protein [Thermoanaerobacterium thermosaccharolyticum DSM 571]AGB19033.1 hypothetical protein Thethe_01391 [Thermoanaerobacterium thermosaccharolyticum M0795]MBE0068045.1 hypothetical protein [Thermoanaerobacterium thermosaccharolyticum]MBE0227789.1 hypothetical protein [Thermoanaerobacterium thermosaccharolyticum]OXT07523.1 hypothetical protein CE561_06780 [Thermoanaerobacterium thermosacchar
MSVNPIDLQVAIPKMVDISNIKQVEIQRPDVFIGQFMEMINNENEIKKSRTNKINESDKPYIKKDKNEVVDDNLSKGRKKFLLGHMDIKI